MQPTNKNVEEVPTDEVFNKEFNRWVSCKTTNIGFDLLILGKESVHCTKLKLKDPDECFTVLTGINSWLDELICTVSDPSMYFILDLNESQHALTGDDMIIDIILTSMALNHIKTGHIYLMFKCKEKKVIKLYNLTSICEIDPEDTGCIVTVLGKLLHKCAAGLQSKPKLLRMLLESSIELLKQEVYPEIISWTHVTLCELYIPLATIPEAPIFMDDYDNTTDNIDISNLQLSLNNLSTEDRCINALRHIALSLDALRFLDSKLEKTLNLQKTAKDQKITKTEFGTSLIAKVVEGKLLATRTTFNGDDELWRDQVKMRLYQNCIRVYATLVEYYFKVESYGASLRCLELLFYYNKIGCDMYTLTNPVVMSSFYLKAGDIFLVYAKNWNQTKINHYKEYCSFTTEDQDILQKVEEDVNKLGGKDAVYVKFGNEDMTLHAFLEKGIKYYNKALTYSKHNSIYKKLIEAYNELGLFFLKKTLDRDYARLVLNLCMKAKTNFNQAVSLLRNDGIEPSLNCAMLYNNIANLHRILASLDAGKNAELEYKTAIINYHTSLKILDGCSSCKENLTFREEVLWNLRSIEFIKACILYEKVNSCTLDLVSEQEVQKALKQLSESVVCCEVSWEHPYFLRYKIILGKIYLYMAVLKFLLLKKNNNHEIFNFNLSAIERLYNDAASLFCEMTQFDMFLWTLHEKLKFLEYLSSATENSKHAMLYLKAGLHGVFSLKILLNYNLNRITNEMAEGLLNFLEDIKFLVQKILHNLLKLVTAMAKSANILKLYKDCYKRSLYIVPNSSVKDAANNLFTVLEEIETDLRKAQQIL